MRSTSTCIARMIMFEAHLARSPLKKDREESTPFHLAPDTHTAIIPICNASFICYAIFQFHAQAHKLINQPANQSVNLKRPESQYM